MHCYNYIENQSEAIQVWLEYMENSLVLMNETCGEPSIIIHLRAVMVSMSRDYEMPFYCFVALLQQITMLIWVYNKKLPVPNCVVLYFIKIT